MEKMTKYCAVIGLEVHIQLSTKRKMFGPERAIYGELPNQETSVVTLAHPGTMPVVNREAVVYAMMAGLACESEISRYNCFDRKNYFYPDLPKGFQITQDKTPICRSGRVIIEMDDGREKCIGLERIHLEEDTGKSIHSVGGDLTLVNFNRAGHPLIEMVTRPDFRSAEEAAAFLYTVRRLVRYLGISNGNMEEGSLRCDANVSIMVEGSDRFGNRVELKNMNSIKHVRLAIAEEIRRQRLIKEGGGDVVPETRSYDVQTGETVFQRVKEGLTDYRYFTEPDLSPFVVDDAWIDSVRGRMPVLPRALVKKFCAVYGLSLKEARVLSDTKEGALFFELVCGYTLHYGVAAYWMMGPIRSYLNTEKVAWADFPLSPEVVAKLADVVADGLISFSVASRTVFLELIGDPRLDPYAIIERDGAQVDDRVLLAGWIDEALAAFPDKVVAYRGGKKGLLHLFVGTVMKISGHRADPKKVVRLLEERLSSDVDV